MHIEPSAAAFAARYAAGAAQVVWTTLVADLETPVSAFLKIAGARPESSLPKTSVPMSFLLESVEGGEVRGRYSIIGLEPDVIFRSNGAQAEINRTPQNNPEAFAPAACGCSIRSHSSARTTRATSLKSRRSKPPSSAHRRTL